jgi:hypothetical protein
MLPNATNPILISPQNTSNIEYLDSASNSPLRAQALILPAFGNQTKYNLANTIFNAQRLFGDYCIRCKLLRYFSVRQGQYYLTAQSSNLNFVYSLQPSYSQLFEMSQNVDGTWSFKDYNGRYIRAYSDLVSINYHTVIGATERWWVERHGNHVHIQSAYYYHNYWITGAGNILQQLNGGASPYIM